MTKSARLALVPLALAQFIAPALPAMGIGQTVAESGSLRGAMAEQPIGAAFSIWGVIFTLCLIFAIYAARKDEPLSRALAPPLALAMMGNCIWMLSAQMLDFQLLNFALLFPILICAWVAACRFDRMRGMGGSAVKLVADMATGLLAGWLSVAVSISVPLTVRTLTGAGATDWPWFMVWCVLVPAALLSIVFMHFVSRSLWFFVAAGWGLLGIVLNAYFVTETALIAYVVLLVGVLVLLYRLRTKPRGRQA